MRRQTHRRNGAAGKTCASFLQNACGKNVISLEKKLPLSSMRPAHRPNGV
jgi:hypothetical protein